MGQRGELFSTRVLLQNRTYFFNVKENRLGDLYLNIVESKNRDDGAFDRQSVILFADDLQEFLKGFDESLRVLEKEMREKRRADRAARPPREDKGRGRPADERPAGGPRGDGGKEGFARRPRADGGKPGQGRPRRDRPQRDDGPGRDSGPPRAGRRVVVKKR